MATMVPANKPSSAPQRRIAPVARRPTTTTTIRVAAPTTRPAKDGTLSGTWDSLPNATGMTPAAISITTTPDTKGVMTLLNMGSHQARANCSRDTTMTRLAKVPGPPWCTANSPAAM